MNSEDRSFIAGVLVTFPLIVFLSFLSVSRADRADRAEQREADYRWQVQQVIDACQIRTDGSAMCPAGAWPTEPITTSSTTATTTAAVSRPAAVVIGAAARSPRPIEARPST